MDPKLQDLLKPEVLHTVDGLELVARIIVEGYMSGSNRSQSIGVGHEFSQYRNYEPGDDLRQLDWKMYARSERYYIKQSDIETNITVKFILDASNSMAYEENKISKLQIAKVMTAALAYLARKQRDTFGLFTVNDQALGIVHPRFEQQQFMRFLNELIHLKSQGVWMTSNNMDALINHQGKEMIIFITDLYDRDQDILEFIASLKTKRNEVIVFHLMGRHEFELDEEGSFTFEELETGERLKVSTAAQKEAYTGQVKDWIEESRSWMLEKQINYHLVFMDEPIEQLLQHFLKSRKQLAR